MTPWIDRKLLVRIGYAVPILKSAVWRDLATCMFESLRRLNLMNGVSGHHTLLPYRSQNGGTRCRAIVNGRSPCADVR